MTRQTRRRNGAAERKGENNNEQQAERHEDGLFLSQDQKEETLTSTLPAAPSLISFAPPTIAETWRLHVAPAKGCAAPRRRKAAWQVFTGASRTTGPAVHAPEPSFSASSLVVET